MVSLVGHVCQFMGRLGQAACEPMRCHALLLFYFCSDMYDSSLHVHRCPEGHMYYVVLVPLVFLTTVTTAVTICFWKWGPAVAHHKLYQHLSAFAALGSMPLAYVGYLGPEPTIPWHNNLHWLIVSGLNAVAQLQTASAGSVAGEHPAEPRTSVREPVLRSTVHALMLLDACSDLALSRSLLRVVRSH